jgi:hypothetical protein
VSLQSIWIGIHGQQRTALWSLKKIEQQRTKSSKSMNKLHLIHHQNNFCRLHTSKLPYKCFFRQSFSSSNSLVNSSKPNDEYSPIVGDKYKRELMNKILRVDHAGEFGAQRIYAGQLALLSGTQYHNELEQMRRQELKHYKTMKELIRERRVRPSLLSPLWNVAGFLLGS